LITDYSRRGRDEAYPLGTIQLMGRSDPQTLRGSFAGSLPDHLAERLR
jgi:hypothetical protein